MSTIYYKIQQHSFKAAPVKTDLYAHKCIHPPTDKELICEELFAAWNGGSGQECWAFRNEQVKNKIHSLSVDDVIILCDSMSAKEDSYWLCESFGWKQITPSELSRHSLKCRVKGAAFA
jgi:hypothetical protein